MLTAKSTKSVRRLLSRRQALGLAASAGLAPMALQAAQSKDAACAPRKRLSNDALKALFKHPAWNCDTIARIEADVAPGKFIHGYATGTVMGVRENEAVKPLFGFEVFSGIRVIRQANGDYQRMCRELVFYRDLATGQILDEWTSVYTGEKLRVVDVANDPFNYIISDHFPDPPSYGGLNQEKPPRRPLLLNWQLMNDDVVTLTTDIHLYYKNALDPAKWPRESSGPMNRVSELFRYVMRRDDVENTALTHLPHTGVWNRITPWLPWMLMGTAPGHVVYAGLFSSVPSVDAVPEPVARRVKERFPLYLTAPEVWQEPSLSSIENYARTQKPAAARLP